MRIFGIDCGFVAPGFAIVETEPMRLIHGECLITTAFKKVKRKDTYKSDDDARRMVEVSDKIAEIVDLFKPDMAVLELPSAGGKSSSAVKGMAIGAAVAVVTLRRLGFGPGQAFPMVYITPRANKIASTRNPTAEKDEVFAAILNLPNFNSFNWPRQVHHKDKFDTTRCWAIADAVSAVICYLRQDR